MVSQHSNQGSFEILIDGDEPSDRGSAPKPPKKRKRGVIIALVVLVSLAALGTVFALGGDDESREDVGEELQGATLKPYVATDVPDTSPAEGGDESDESDAEEPFRPRMVEEGFQGERYHRDEDPTISPSSQPVDGDRVQLDARGTRISRREANERAKRELDSIQNSERAFERRLRRREAILQSRIFSPGAEGAVELAPGVELDDNLRQRIEEEFRNRERPTSFMPESQHREYGDGVTYPSISETWEDGDSVDEDLDGEW